MPALYQIIESQLGGRKKSKRRGTKSSKRRRSKGKSKSKRRGRSAKRGRPKGSKKRRRSASRRRSRINTYTGAELARRAMPFNRRVGRSNLESMAPKMPKMKRPNIKMPGMNKTIGAESRAIMNMMKQCPPQLIHSSTSPATAFAKCLAHSRMKGGEVDGANMDE